MNIIGKIIFDGQYIVEVLLVYSVCYFFKFIFKGFKEEYDGDLDQGC